MAGYLIQDTGTLTNEIHDITYEQISELYRDNKREERENRRITASSYRGENFYDGVNDNTIGLYKEYLYRDPKTAGMRLYYPHGVVIEPASRRNYYRGENQIYQQSIPSLLRTLQKYPTRKEQELYRMVADMRIVEFTVLLKYFQHVNEWKSSDILYEALAQHYGLETGWLDITNDFDVALFFATCFYDKTAKMWKPLTKEQTEINEQHKYGMLFHMPSYVMASRWNFENQKFMPCTDKIVGKTDEGNDIYEVLKHPIYRGNVGNLAYPLGFQPFMRCHMQNGYGIYMRNPQPLQEDIGFEKLRFRHNEKLSKDVYDMMLGGDYIYPHEGLKQAEFIIDEIRNMTTFSEEAFQYALYRNHYYRIADEDICREALENFVVDGRKIHVVQHHTWGLSSGRRKRIDSLYQGFSLEDWYGIHVVERKRFPACSKMFEPWMLPDADDNPGVYDFRLREKLECGTSILDRNMMNLLATMMMAEQQDF